jgi:hypothetical protein
MSKILNGAMAAGLALAIAMGGSVATADTAEAGKKYHSGSGNYWVKKYAGTNNFSSNTSCDWYYAKWEQTGNWKWYGRWQRCIH